MTEAATRKVDVLEAVDVGPVIDADTYFVFFQSDPGCPWQVYSTWKTHRTPESVLQDFEGSTYNDTSQHAIKVIKVRLPIAVEQNA